MSSDPAAPDGTSVHRDARPERSFRKMLAPFFLPALLGLLLLITVVLVVLGTVGFPDSIARKVEAHLAKSGFVVRLEKIRFNLFRGVLADGVRFYNDLERREIMMQAERLQIEFSLRRAFGGKGALAGLFIEDGSFVLYRDPGDSSQTPLMLEHVNGELALEPAGLRVRSLEAEVLGMDLTVKGFVVSTGKGKWDASAFSAPLNRLGEQAPGWYPNLLAQLADMKFSLPPQIDIDFMIHPEQPGFTELTLHAEGVDAHVRGAIFDRWEITAQVKDLVIQIEKALLSRGDRWFSGTGRVDLRNKRFSASAYSDLSMSYWRYIIPAAWRERLDRDIVFNGPLAIELTFPDTSFSEPGKAFSGWVSFEDADIRRLRFPAGRVRFSFCDGVLDLDQIVGTLASGDVSGEVDASFRYDFKTTGYSGHIRTDCPPVLFTPILTAGREALARRVSVDPTGRVELDIAFGGIANTSNTFCWSGTLGGSNFYYNGAFLNSFSAEMVMTNEILHVEPIVLKREEGIVRGWLAIDYITEIMSMDLAGPVHPGSLARFIGPHVERGLRFVRSEGSCLIAARGFVDFKTNRLTDLHFTVDAENLGTGWFLGETCSLDGYLRGTNLIITNMMGMYAGGFYEASARVEGISVATSLQIEASAQWTNVNLRYLVREVRQDEADPFRGRFSGAIQLKGMTGPHMVSNMLGRGHAVVKSGRLFQFSLFGGLSRLLDKLSPGLGSVKQTDLKANFKLGNGRLSSRDVQLEGDLVRLEARGECTYDGQLDFSVQVKPLRDGPVGNVVDFITMPVTRLLLEFKLYGTVNEPRWRPENLPKELLFLQE